MVFTVMVPRVTGSHHRARSTRLLSHQVSHHVPHILTTSISRNLTSLFQKESSHLRLLANLPESILLPLQLRPCHQPTTFFKRISAPGTSPVKGLTQSPETAPSNANLTPRTVISSAGVTPSPGPTYAFTTCVERSDSPSSGSVCPYGATATPSIGSSG